MGPHYDVPYAEVKKSQVSLAKLLRDVKAGLGVIAQTLVVDRKG